MMFRPRRSSWALAACGFVLVASQALVPSSMSATSDRSCAALQQWARAYAQASPTLDEIARIDRAHRVAIFATVTPAVRASLVQEHLRRFAARPHLSPAQRALIWEGRELATPSLYARDAAAAQAFERFWQRAEPMFTSSADRMPWFDLGSGGARVRASASAQEWDYCTCNFNHQWPECPGQCDAGGCLVEFGCGPGLHYICNGRCP